MVISIVTPLRWLRYRIIIPAAVFAEFRFLPSPPNALPPVCGKPGGGLWIRLRDRRNELQHPLHLLASAFQRRKCENNFSRGSFGSGAAIFQPVSLGFEDYGRPRIFLDDRRVVLRDEVHDINGAQCEDQGCLGFISSPPTSPWSPCFTCGPTCDSNELAMALPYVASLMFAILKVG